MQSGWRENCGTLHVATQQSRRKQTPPRPTRQRGAIMLLLALLLVITGSWLGLRMLATPKAISGIQVSDAALKEARDAIIGASMAMTVANVTRPGQLATPDFLDPAEVPANYDGNFNACALSTWVAGAALPVMGATLDVRTRCFGRLPWVTLGLGMFGSSNQSDPTGSVPWYAMSVNLAASTCLKALNPALLNTAYTPGTCGSATVTQPFPWLTVRDYKGNLLTNRAAFVLLLPGLPLGGQTRPSAPLAGPAAYLDTVTVTAACSQPCVPGTYNNARFNWPDNVGLSFVQCAPPSQMSPNDPSFTQPYQCNDRLLYVTIDELLELAERRAMSFAAEKLQAFYSSNQFYPFAAPVNPTVAGDLGKCRNGITSGLIPHLAGTPTIGTACSPVFAAGAWFDANNWGRYIYYATVADCAQPTTNCSGGINRLAAGPVANARALVIGAGAPIIAAPFATSKAGVAQIRSATASVADYLDSAENADGNSRFDAPTTALTRSYNDKTLVVAP